MTCRAKNEFPIWQFTNVAFQDVDIGGLTYLEFPNFLVRYAEKGKR